jgi:hypothetical protein
MRRLPTERISLALSLKEQSSMVRWTSMNFLPPGLPV